MGWKLVPHARTAPAFLFHTAELILIPNRITRGTWYGVDSHAAAAAVLTIRYEA